MARKELPLAFQPDTRVRIIHSHGPIFLAKVTKRTATQITTEDINGRVERWVSGWASGGDYLQPYGSAEVGCIIGAYVATETSPRLKAARTVRAKRIRTGKLNTALDTMRKHPSIEAGDELLHVLSEWMEAERAG